VKGVCSLAKYVQKRLGTRHAEGSPSVRPRSLTDFHIDRREETCHELNWILLTRNYHKQEWTGMFVVSRMKTIETMER
jgi:hypothetical protein